MYRKGKEIYGYVQGSRVSKVRTESLSEITANITEYQKDIKLLEAYINTHPETQLKSEWTNRNEKLQQEQLKLKRHMNHYRPSHKKGKKK